MSSLKSLHFLILKTPTGTTEENVLQEEAVPCSQDQGRDKVWGGRKQENCRQDNEGRRGRNGPEKEKDTGSWPSE